MEIPISDYQMSILQTDPQTADVASWLGNIVNSRVMEMEQNIKFNYANSKTIADLNIDVTAMSIIAPVKPAQ